MSAPVGHDGPAFRRAEAIQVLARLRTAEAVIVGPGTSSGMLEEADHRAPVLYNMELGSTCGVALGLSLTRPDVGVVALDGDGSLAASLGVLATIGRYRPGNLVVVVLDNRLYESCGAGDVATVTAYGTDLAQVGRACGLAADRVLTPADSIEFEDALACALREPGPWLLVAPIRGDRGEPDEVRPVPRSDAAVLAAEFRSALA